ncbi:GR25 family glycosyltransferase involved in LPS biosynthesis [Sphingobium sp. B11D3B]|uniref:glycosyltransferase family 25 protein n=1 Tax=Sphingobium sp. B11D3B TaxID=2940575 RepID=UPI0022264E01|nr:glycosyltransferase family 25 protein [Sphingobium sp. B11D3B]MCW2388473.1 GR25 family glycosyltransferase involved in LPS biosynthesis [Sphingobium sp. B11D3B]
MVSPTPAGRALVDAFDAIRIINLPHRADRRREMAAQFRRLGLDLDHPKIAFFTAKRFSDAAGFPTPGTRGCFDSHMSVLREAAEAGHRSVLVLEDDFDFHDRIETVLPAALTKLGGVEWDIFFGSLLPGQYEATERPLELIPPGKGLAGCHFYAVRGDTIGFAAHYLAAMLERPAGGRHPDGEPMHYDGALSVLRNRHPELRTYVANPDLGHQRLSRTDIHDVRFYDRLPVLRTFASLLRRAIRLSGRTRQMGRKSV